MSNRQFYKLSFLGLIFVTTFIFAGCNTINNKNQSSQTTIYNNTQTPSPTPTPYTTYSPPNIKEKDVYIIALLGDSMTEALGPLGGPFAKELNNLYRNQTIIVDNYSIGSTNILSVHDRLTQELVTGEWDFPPLIERDDVDLIILGSFAYNPLSEITNRQEAIDKQNQTLQDIMMRLENEMPNTRVIFLATIAPNSKMFGKPSLKVTDEERVIQVEERKQYLKNHIEFAREYNIPVVNVYEESLTELGDGDLEYINPDDNIHPSAVGVDFISTQLAEFIYENQILPIKE